MKKITACIALICLVSCNTKNQNSTEPEEIIVEIPESFVSFYENFHTDSAYQMDHIIFPLEGAPNNGKWLQDDWTIHREFDDMDGDFIREFDNFNGLIIETIVDKTATVSFERRYAKMGDEYYLIYYNINSKFGE